MADETQRIHRFTVDGDVQLDELTLPVTQEVVVKGSVAASPTLKPIEKVKKDLAQGQLVGQHYAGGGGVIHGTKDAAPLRTQLHAGTDVFGWGHDGSQHVRFRYF